MTDPASPSLALARDLRKAVQARAESLAPAIEAYDFAATSRERFHAAAKLMLAIEAADREYVRATDEAVQRCERAEA